MSQAGGKNDNSFDRLMSPPWACLRCFRHSDESSDNPSGHGRGLGVTTATEGRYVGQEADTGTAAQDQRLTWKEKEATMRLKDHLRKLEGHEAQAVPLKFTYC